MRNSNAIHTVDFSPLDIRPLFFLTCQKYTSYMIMYLYTSTAVLVSASVPTFNKLHLNSSVYQFRLRSCKIVIHFGPYGPSLETLFLSIQQFQLCQEGWAQRYPIQLIFDVIGAKFNLRPAIVTESFHTLLQILQIITSDFFLVFSDSARKIILTHLISRHITTESDTAS